MFNSFRKGTRFDDAAKQKLIEAVSGMLEIQKVVAGSHLIEDENGKINRKAIGYIYGFVDSALTAFGQDKSDGAMFFSIIYQVMRHLFPGQEERYMQFLMERMGKDDAVTLGAMKGGQQYIDFVVKRRPEGGMAMGFAHYLREGDDGKGGASG